MKGHDVSRPQEIKNNNTEEGHNSLYPYEGLLNSSNK